MWAAVGDPAVGSLMLQATKDRESQGLIKAKSSRFMADSLGIRRIEYLFHMALGKVIDTLSWKRKMDKGACTCMP
jgi:hypothetical protein